MMREFARHTADIPIAVQVAMTDKVDSAMVNLSVGGLCCEADSFLPIGTEIDINIPLLSPEYSGKGVVSWCREKDGDRFEVGVSFHEGDMVFRSRMVEQVCQIVHYKNEIKATEGRVLSNEEAAKEWIKKYASSFDVDGTQGSHN